MKSLILISVSALSCLAATAADKYWLGTTSASASEGANWNPSGAPTADDDVILDANSNNNPLTWDLNNGVKSWTQSSYTGTVTFKTGVGMSGVTCYGVDTGVMTGEKGFPISGNLSLLSGTWTHTEQPAFDTSTKKATQNYKQGYGVYRIVVSVGGTCEIGANAKIDVDGKGFATSSGPGYSNSCASHGGFGGYNYNITTSTNVIYGSIRQPISSGSGRDSRGGGAVKMTVAGALTLNGSLTSVASKTVNYPGSGGSIWVTAASLTGAGTMTADGGTGKISAGCGGGGRVAVYLTETDADFSGFTGTMTAKNANVYGSCGTVYRETKADNGKGELILESGLTSVSIPKFYSTRTCGTLLKPTYAGATDHSFRKITLGQWAKLYVLANQTLTVGDGGVSGYSNDASKLLLDGVTLNLPADFQHANFALSTYLNPVTINVGQSADAIYTVLNTGYLLLDGPTTLNCDLDVNGTISHSGNTGAAPAYTNRLDMTVTGDMTINANGINVSTKGFDTSNGPGGSASAEYGGVYGGVVPGLDANVYGSILHPTDLGSSGTVGGAAGAVKLTVGGTLTIGKDGAINAHGNYNNGGSNGSGGSVWLTVGEIAGNGTVNVRGGTYGGTTARAAAGGSGGRIAVRQTVGNKTASQCSVAFHYAGGGSTGGVSSGSGTFYWERADDGQDRGTVYYSSAQLPPVGMPADELTNATIQVGSSTTLSLIDDASVGQFNLPSGATLQLAGHTLSVVNPTQLRKKSIKGTVDDSQGGTLCWMSKKRFMVIVR